MSSKLEIFSMLCLMKQRRPSVHTVLCQLQKINFSVLTFWLSIPVTDSNLCLLQRPLNQAHSGAVKWIF